MNLQLMIGLLLTFVPFVELRGGLPVVVEYLTRNNMFIWPYFLLILLLNFLIIIIAFLFLDFFHERFMHWNFYSKTIGRKIEKIQIRAEKIDKKNGVWKYVALAFFVSIPLPMTGAWAGSVIAWVLGLNRLKSFLAISLGIILAGLLVLFASLGILGLL